MKKTAPAHTHTKFEEYVHELYHSADDEMDRRELKAYLDDENQPRFDALNEDDRIGVEEVLVIGSYMVLHRLHQEMHLKEIDALEGKMKEVFAGKIEVKAIAPENMPQEVVEALQTIVDISRKRNK